MVKDYKGQEFESYKQMAENYHLMYQTFLWRRKNNWSLEECLTGKTKHKSSVDASKRTDHLGRVYQSVEDMCKAWNVTPNTYHIRKSRGYSLEECLIGIKNVTRDKGRYEVEDHLGNKFESKQKMCEYYNIPYYTYLDRLRRGLSMKESLTSYELNRIKCKDHLGNEFNSIKEMCEYWKVSVAAYRSRRKRGLSIEDCLTMESEHSYSITDHLGNKFSSKLDMCNFYNIPCNTYRYRINCGWSQEKALTTKVNENITKESTTDHLGNRFNSIEEMCKHYGITQVTYKDRIKRGWTKRKALITPSAYGNTALVEDRTDHKGNVFNSRMEMLKFYECNLGRFYRGLKSGKTKDEILRECEDRQNRKIIAEKNWIVDNLIYTASDGTMYYVCHRDDGTEDVLSANEAKAM